MITDLIEARVEELGLLLQSRFEKNMHRHKGLDWAKIKVKLVANKKKLWSLYEMEKTGGESDVVAPDVRRGDYTYCDCSTESPKERRSICFDTQAQQSRKENKPVDDTIGMAAAMGIALLAEAQYKELQQLELFDTKSFSWIATPAAMRKLGGAL